MCHPFPNNMKMFFSTDQKSHRAFLFFSRLPMSHLTLLPGFIYNETLLLRGWGEAESRWNIPDFLTVFNLSFENPNPVFLGFPCVSASKESACNAGDLVSIPGLGRSPGEGKGYPLQYSGLENSMDCMLHGVVRSRTPLSNFRFRQPQPCYMHRSSCSTSGHNSKQLLILHFFLLYFLSFNLFKIVV